MKTSALLCFAMFLGCKQQKPESIVAGDLSIELSTAPDPPTAGDNTLHVKVQDIAGKAVDGAELHLRYDMPAMGAMPEMSGRGEVIARGEGLYDVAYSIAMNGDWTLSLDVRAANHTPASVRLKVSPPRKGFVIENHGAASSASTDGRKILEISPHRQQLIGVTFANVEERSLTKVLRATGRIEVDERQVAEVTLKFEAYAQQLFVGETGKAVKAGDPLVKIYSAELLAAEEEFLQARRSETAQTPGSAEIIRAASRRLKLWDMTNEQIEDLVHREKADGTLVIHSPVSGVVLEKGIDAGTHATPGTMLYRVGNLGNVWVQAALYESDSPLVAVGQPAAITMPAFPGVTLRGRVSFVSPTLDVKTRTLPARMELQNARMLLKPGMFAEVRIEVPLGTHLAIPSSALLVSGEHRYVFVERGEGKLEAVEVQMGEQTDGFVEVLSGLVQNDRVVTGASFLVSSEAQLRDALPRWSAP